MIINKIKTNKVLEKYANEYFKSIEKNKNILIEAFIQYYGEKYRNTITEKINETNFYTFISNCAIEIIYDNIINNSINDKDLLEDLKLIFNTYKNKNYFTKTFINNTKLDNFYKKQIVEALSNNIHIFGFHIFTFDDDNNPIQNVFTSIFSDDKNLIHELNHVITSTALAFEIIDNDVPATIVKNGIATSYASDHHKVGNSLEEVINDKISFEITEIFHKLGGKIVTHNIDYPDTTYLELFPVIDKFYNKYKSLLIEARITEDTNTLFKEIDKRKFEEFQIMIDKCLEIVVQNKKVPNWIVDEFMNDMDLNNNNKSQIKTKNTEYNYTNDEQILDNKQIKTK